MKTVKTTIVTHRMRDEEIAALDRLVACTGTNRSEVFSRLLAAAVATTDGATWSCRTVHLVGNRLHVRGSRDPLLDAGLHTEIVAPQLFWDRLDAETP